MKPNLTYLFFAITILCSYQLKGQKTDTTYQETIVKLENPYKKGKTKWLNSNGFNTDTYQWNDPEINLYLDQSLKVRSTANILMYTGGAIFVSGLVLNAMGRLAKDIGSSKPDEPYQVFKTPYYLGGVLMVSSIPFHIKSRKRLKAAIHKASK